jgi:hypothetical protein
VVVQWQLATGTGIAPFRGFLWRMFFEKHDDYKVNTVSSDVQTIVNQTELSERITDVRIVHGCHCLLIIYTKNMARS